MPSEKVKDLADSLFRVVEAEQGRAFISDGLDALDTIECVLDAAQKSLRHTENVAKILRKWLTKHGRGNAVEEPK